MILTTPHERALEDLDRQLEPIRQRRAKVIDIVRQTTAKVSAAKSWRNPHDAAAEARLAFQALDDFRTAVRQLEVSLAMAGGNPLVQKSLSALHINHYGKEVNCAPLLRVLGDETSHKAAMKRLDSILKSLHCPQQPINGAPVTTAVYKLLGSGKENLAQRVNWSNRNINEEEMSATFVINTDAVDRQGELILPTGVDFTNYRKNPVVLFEHGLDPGFPTPIARCETPDGKLAIDVSHDRIKATAYFIRGDNDSETMWTLVKNGAIRAASIHVIPTAPPVHRIIDGRSVKVFTESSMLEWSLGRVGVNQEATI